MGGSRSDFTLPPLISYLFVSFLNSFSNTYSRYLLISAENVYLIIWLSLNIWSNQKFGVKQNSLIFFQSFYWRSRIRWSNYVCNNNGHCQIGFENRRNCQSCRLEKCFKVGMRWPERQVCLGYIHNIFIYL